MLLPRGWRIEHTRPIRGSKWSGYRVATIVEPKGDRFCSVTAKQRLEDEAALGEQGDGSTPDDANRSFCEVCGGSGLFLCCEGCPAVLHKACVKFEFPDCPIPDGAFYCPECRSCGVATDDEDEDDDEESGSESASGSGAETSSESDSDSADFQKKEPWHEVLGRRARGAGKGKGKGKGKRQVTGKGRSRDRGKGKGRGGNARRGKSEAPVLLEKEAATVPSRARLRAGGALLLADPAGVVSPSKPRQGGRSPASPLSLAKRRQRGKPRGAVFLPRPAPKSAKGGKPFIAKLPASRALRLTPAQVAARKVLPAGSAPPSASESPSSDDDGDDLVPATMKRMVVCADGNEAFCSVCGVGGAIVCCDGCPASFHQQCCFQLRAADDDADQWECPSCSVLSCYEQVATSYRQQEAATKGQRKRMMAAADMVSRFASLVKVRACHVQRCAPGLCTATVRLTHHLAVCDRQRTSMGAASASLSSTSRSLYGSPPLPPLPAYSMCVLTLTNP